MTTYLVIGDPHYKLGNLERTTSMIEEIEKSIKKIKPNYIVCLGDTLDRFANVRQEPLTQATNFFRMLRSYAPTYILIGNHDRPNNSVFCTDEHPFNSMKYWTNIPNPITIIDYPLISNNVVYVPYVPDSRFIEALNLLGDSWKISKLIFAHQDFYGAKYNNQLSTTGDRWESSHPLVISGHIHDYQELGNNIIYCGSPIQHAYDESPIKSLLLVTINNDDDIKTERLLLDIPIFWTYHLLFEDIDTYKPPKLPRYSDMKLKIEGSLSEIKSLGKIKKIKEWQKIGIKIQPIVKKLDTIKKLSLLSSNEKKSKTFIQLLRESSELSDNAKLVLSSY
jgi:DNA repair exonuclease SbcCD nuclease subunit